MYADMWNLPRRLSITCEFIFDYTRKYVRWLISSLKGTLALSPNWNNSFFFTLINFLSNFMRKKNLNLLFNKLQSLYFISNPHDENLNEWKRMKVWQKGEMSWRNNFLLLLTTYVSSAWNEIDPIDIKGQSLPSYCCQGQSVGKSSIRAHF